MANNRPAEPGIFLYPDDLKRPTDDWVRLLRWRALATGTIVGYLVGVALAQILNWDLLLVVLLAWLLLLLARGNTHYE